MKRFHFITVSFIIICLVAMMVIPAAANSVTEDGTVTIDSGIYGYGESNSIYSVRGLFHSYFPVFLKYTSDTSNRDDSITFNLNTEFSKPTTTYSDSLSRLSCAMSAITLLNNKHNTLQSLIEAMFPGKAYTFDYIDVLDTETNSEYPFAATGEYIATSTIQRNGHDCKVIIVAFEANTKGLYATSISDMLMVDDKTAGLTGDDLTAKKSEIYNSDRLYAVTDASDFAYKGIHSYVPTDGSDFVFWIVGEMRSGAVANDLASQLIDQYGTEHVVAYTYGSMNVSRSALDSTQTSKYNSIFNIVNSDDAVCYLPLGSDYGEGWGYKRWGTDIVLGFPDVTEENKKTIDLSKTKFYTALNTAFHNYVYDNTEEYGNAYVPYDYAVYDSSNFDGIPNGGSIKEFMSSMKVMLPSIADYYDKPLTMYKAKAVIFSEITTVDSLYIYLKGYISLATDDDDESDFNTSIAGLILDLKYSADKDCDVHDMLVYGIKHGFHSSSTDDLLTNSGLLTNIISGDGFKLPIYEAVTGTLSEAYLAWMSINSEGYTPRDGFLTTLPETAAVNTLTSNDVTVSNTENVFYSDQSFTATKITNGYTLTFGYTSGKALEANKELTPCNPYDEVTIKVPSPAGITQDYTAYFNGKPLEMTYSDGYLYGQISQLNGTLVFPVTISKTENSVTVTVSSEIDGLKDTLTLVLASYNSDGKMTAAVSTDFNSFTATISSFGNEGETVKAFFINEDMVPTYKSLYIVSPT